MLRSINDLKGFDLVATGGEIGDVNQFYFDDERWAVRYLIVNTGDWVAEQQVLISPFSVTQIDLGNRKLHVALNKEQVERSLNINTHKPVSRQMEATYSDYYGYPYYWRSPLLWGAGVSPDQTAPQTPAILRMATSAAAAAMVRVVSPEVHLHSTQEVTTYHIAATDGLIGYANDFIVDGDHSFSIVTAKAVSTDIKYNTSDVADVSVTNVDNDQASVVITQTGALSVTETGTTATFTIALTSLPTADVTIGLSSSDPTQGTVSPSSLVFTKTNGMTPQTVTIKGVDDLIVDGNHAFTIVTTKAVSTDTKYNNLDVPDVSVTNVDNDQPGIIVTQASSLTVDEQGTTATFTIVLALAPTADVTIALSSSDTTQGTVSSASLVFTTANGLTPQTVTVTGVDDLIVDGNRTFTILTAKTQSTQAAYNGLDVNDVVVNSLDNGSRPYQNPTLHLDANDSKTVTVLDALVILNDISRRKQRTLPNVKAAGDLFYDTNGDGKCSVLDALVVLNGLSRAMKPSGEAPALQPVAAPMVAAPMVEPMTTSNDNAKKLDDLIELLATDQTPV